MDKRIPPEFAQKMGRIYGERGKQWITALPSLIAQYEAAWQIRVEAPVSNLSYNYVARARRQGEKTAVIFKAGVPTPEILTEMETLRLVNGRGMVRLLASAPEDAVMLLAQISPGTELATMTDDAQATRIIADLIDITSTAPPASHAFPSLRDWTAVFARFPHQYPDAPIPRSLLDQATQLARDLLASTETERLLHGDLHHFNVLEGENGRWVVIDPKGVVGDPAFETARFLHNPYPHLLMAPNLAQIIDRRVSIVVERLGFDRQRVLGWGLVDTMLSTCWSVEDSDDDHLTEMLAFAEGIGKMV